MHNHYVLQGNLVALHNKKQPFPEQKTSTATKICISAYVRIQKHTHTQAKIYLFRLIFNSLANEKINACSRILRVNWGGHLGCSMLLFVNTFNIYFGLLFLEALNFQLWLMAKSATINFYHQISQLSFLFHIILR